MSNQILEEIYDFLIEESPKEEDFLKIIEKDALYKQLTPGKLFELIINYLLTKEKTNLKILKPGYVYAMKNEEFNYWGDHIYKLGNTQDLQTRLGSYTTNYLEECNMDYKSDFLENCILAEKILFLLLDEYRIKKNREFFDCKIDTIKEAINNINSLFKGGNMKKAILKYKELRNDKNQKIIDKLKLLNIFNNVEEFNKKTVCNIAHKSKPKEDNLLKKAIDKLLDNKELENYQLKEIMTHAKAFSDNKNQQMLFLEEINKFLLKIQDQDSLVQNESPKEDGKNKVIKEMAPMEQQRQRLREFIQQKCRTGQNFQANKGKFFAKYLDWCKTELKLEKYEEERKHFKNLLLDEGCWISKGYIKNVELLPEKIPDPNQEMLTYLQKLIDKYCFSDPYSLLPHKALYQFMVKKYTKMDYKKFTHLMLKNGYKTKRTTICNNFIGLRLKDLTD